MEIWGIIGEEHRSLEDLIGRIELGQDDCAALLRKFEHELLAHTEAEEEALYPMLRNIGGFEEPVSRAAEHDGKLRAMVKELGRARPQVRLSSIEEIKTALAQHVKEQSDMLPLARHELPYYAAEHMKHEFEEAKEHAMARLTSSHVEQSMSPSASDATTIGDGNRGELAERLLRRENDNAFVCQAAVDRLKEPSHRSVVGELAEDHLRRASELGNMLSASHVTPNRTKDAERLPGWAKVAFASLAGDKSILKAIRSSEEHINIAYGRILEDEHPSAAMRDLLHSLVEDGHRHRDQIDAALNSIEAFNQVHS